MCVCGPFPSHTSLDLTQNPHHTHPSSPLLKIHTGITAAASPRSRPTSSAGCCTPTLRSARRWGRWPPTPGCSRGARLAWAWGAIMLMAAPRSWSRGGRWVGAGGAEGGEVVVGGGGGGDDGGGWVPPERRVEPGAVTVVPLLWGVDADRHFGGEGGCPRWMGDKRSHEMLLFGLQEEREQNQKCMHSIEESLVSRAAQVHGCEIHKRGNPQRCLDVQQVWVVIGV